MKDAVAFKVAKRIMRKSSGDAQARINAATNIASRARAIGQVGLCEEMTRQIFAVKAEAAMDARGYNVWVDRNAIIRLTDRTSLRLTELGRFGRPIPEPAAGKIIAANQSKAFSEIHILHAGEAMIKTMADRVREKDPIAFGVCSTFPDKLFFIADWVDDLCNLTLGQLLTHPEFQGSLSSSSEEELAAELKRKEQVLADTNSNTWRQDFERMRMAGLAASAPANPVSFLKWF